MTDRGKVRLLSLKQILTNLVGVGVLDGPMLQRLTSARAAIAKSVNSDEPSLTGKAFEKFSSTFFKRWRGWRGE